MSTRKKDNPTVKHYRKNQDFDPEFDVHILDGALNSVAVYATVPKVVGQEAMVMCLDASETVQLQCPAGVVFGTSSDVLTFDTGDNVLLRAISLTKWLIVVNNGVSAN